MCSKRCAKPVLPVTSSREPTWYQTFDGDDRHRVVLVHEDGQAVVELERVNTGASRRKAAPTLAVLHDVMIKFATGVQGSPRVEGTPGGYYATTSGGCSAGVGRGVEEAAMKCPSCGGAVEDGADLCLECGEPMGDSPAAKVAKKESVVIRPPADAFASPEPPAPSAKSAAPSRTAKPVVKRWPTEEPEPKRCPGCGGRSFAARCPACGIPLGPKTIRPNRPGHKCRLSVPPS